MAQIKQRETYIKRHQKADIIFKLGDEVLLKSLRRNDKITRLVSNAMDWFICH